MPKEHVPKRTQAGVLRPGSSATTDAFPKRARWEPGFGVRSRGVYRRGGTRAWLRRASKPCPRATCRSYTASKVRTLCPGVSPQTLPRCHHPGACRGVCPRGTRNGEASRQTRHGTGRVRRYTCRPRERSGLCGKKAIHGSTRMDRMYRINVCKRSSFQVHRDGRVRMVGGTDGEIGGFAGWRGLRRHRREDLYSPSQQWSLQ